MNEIASSDTFGGETRNDKEGQLCTHIPAFVTGSWWLGRGLH